MGRLLTISFLLMLSSSAYSSALELGGLVDRANLSGEEVVSFVRSGMNTYSEDPVIKACVKKLDTDRNAAIYALFNYIMYLDLQKSSHQIASTNNLKKTRQLILVSNYAKKSVNYCNP